MLRRRRRSSEKLLMMIILGAAPTLLLMLFNLNAVEAAGNEKNTVQYGVDCSFPVHYPVRCEEVCVWLSYCYTKELGIVSQCLTHLSLALLATTDTAFLLDAFPGIPLWRECSVFQWPSNSLQGLPTWLWKALWWRVMSRIWNWEIRNGPSSTTIYGGTCTTMLRACLFVYWFQWDFGKIKGYWSRKAKGSISVGWLLTFFCIAPKCLLFTIETELYEKWIRVKKGTRKAMEADNQTLGT